MKLTFYGACKTVTGSCYLIETEDTKLLIDCGMYQGPKELKERNYRDFLFNPAEIDYVVLTHAHIDHSGLLPKLMKKGFKGPIITTKATMDLCSIMLPDSGHIQELEIERKNRKLLRAGKQILEPIYDHLDASKVMLQFKGLDYELVTELSPTVSIRLQDAGHILGSAIVEMWIKQNEKKIKLVFSGDLGNYNQPIVKDPTNIDDADYLIMESTYGNRIHENKGDKKEILLKIIEETFERGGNLIIPAFAVERTQDILYYLGILEQEGRLPDCDIYIDSPLAISASEIFKTSVQYYDEETKKAYETLGQSPIILKKLKMARTQEESMRLNEVRGRTIIISASGMCEAGRIKHHLKHNLWRPESSVLFVGFQAEGTLGRQIIEGQKTVKIHGEEIAVKAKIYNVEGFSAHADQPALLKWVGSFKKLPRKVFLVHGEIEGIERLKGLLEKNLSLDVIVPDWQQSFELAAEKQVSTPKKLTDRDLELLYNTVINKLNQVYKSEIEKSDLELLYDKLKNIEKAI
ncbi:MBL fold metallo-hydrolase [Thermoanaerobacteraceae bacterium SP2]|jgi:metallo-beta-lactamase family protein|nr:metallo-beta-lactamase family protein [Thermoanaerobacteraceae bacterium]RKL64293.1 MBL fold metallo-hydrolase [Thermoanaerobacteraceae bacterium SP2]